MNTDESTEFFSQYAANYGYPIGKEAKPAWESFLHRDGIAGQIAMAVMHWHLENRESPAEKLLLAPFAKMYFKRSRLASMGLERVDGCDDCEQTGYLHQVYGGNPPDHGTPVDFFSTVFVLLDVMVERPMVYRGYRLCGIPCPNCSLGKALLEMKADLPDGYVSDAEVARLQGCGMAPSVAKAWCDYLSGQQDKLVFGKAAGRAPRRTRKPETITGGRVSANDMNWLQAQEQEKAVPA